METIKEYSLRVSNDNDIFDFWLADNIERLLDEKIDEEVILIQSQYEWYSSIFEKSFETGSTDLVTVRGVGIYINELGEYPEFTYNDSDDEEKERQYDNIIDWIKEHTIEVDCTGYSKWDYENFFILIRDLRKKKKIEKEFDFIKKLYKISETTITFYETEIKIIDWERFTWEEVEIVQAGTWTEFPKDEELKLLVKEYGNLTEEQEKALDSLEVPEVQY